MKALLYCVKSKPYLFGHYVGFDTKYQYDLTICKEVFSFHKNVLNGKIVAEVEIDKVEEIVATKWDVACGCAYYQCKTKDLLKKSCLKYIDLNDYLDRENGYALHLTNLNVFNRPKELSEYYLFDPDYCILKKIKKAPQNMCRVVERYGLIEVPGKEYVLISVQPQHLCKILNGEKTIEVRRKVLNCLKEMCKDE